MPKCCVVFDAKTLSLHLVLGTLTHQCTDAAFIDVFGAGETCNYYRMVPHGVHVYGGIRISLPSFQIKEETLYTYTPERKLGYAVHFNF